MTAKTFLVACACALVVSLGGSSSAQTSAACTVDLDNGQQAAVEVKRGETFSICLPLTAGTGYSWRIRPGRDAEAVPAKGEPAFETEAQRPGARGKVRFVLSAAAAGRFTLTFLLIPPGRRDEPAGTAALVVSVL